jgi:hypothetical protein
MKEDQRVFCREHDVNLNRYDGKEYSENYHYVFKAEFDC